jgi:ATP-dependent Clp protease protease subunit
VTHRKPLLWGGFEGQATDIETHAGEVIALKRRIEEIIAQHTGQTARTGASKDTERDYFMTSEQANQYGIDQVIPNRIGTG